MESVSLPITWQRTEEVWGIAVLEEGLSLEDFKKALCTGKVTSLSRAEAGDDAGIYDSNGHRLARIQQEETETYEDTSWVLDDDGETWEADEEIRFGGDQ